MGPLTGYTITDYDADGNLQTRSSVPLDDSINPGGVVDTGETIDFGVVHESPSTRLSTLPFVLTNTTPNGDLGELTALTIVDAIIGGEDAHQFSLWEADGVTPFDADLHGAGAE